METITCRIHENSFIARLAAWKLGVPAVAMVLGRTIHLYGASREEFLADEHWVRHEVCHVKQYRQYGYGGFLWRYLLATARQGYYHNHLEVAARAASEDPAIMENVEIV
ncbi:eCIS core domain-containing protein [Chitinophaga vietnamensis]|uniref:eCIS core domain-containing protein n=1 Tax=Chitinophaga vietnamensis TaxID=2593957 RepID=UPI001177D9A4|nr:DUF4157 domain-containing protein [Chitinophaga vietnamensis]